MKNKLPQQKFRSAREIKFRAWYPNDRCLVSWQLLCREPNWLKELLVSRPDIPLMQFTGLLDKNKNEIYESDIIEKDGERWQILWDENRAGFRFLSVDSKMRKFGGLELRLPESVGSQKYLMEEMTVVGNIYENPDLLNL